MKLTTTVGAAGLLLATACGGKDETAATEDTSVSLIPVGQEVATVEPAACLHAHQEGGAVRDLDIVMTVTASRLHQHVNQDPTVDTPGTVHYQGQLTFSRPASGLPVDVDAMIDENRVHCVTVPSKQLVGVDPNDASRAWLSKDPIGADAEATASFEPHRDGVAYVSIRKDNLLTDEDRAASIACFRSTDGETRGCQASIATLEGGDVLKTYPDDEGRYWDAEPQEAVFGEDTGL